MSLHTFLPELGSFKLVLLIYALEIAVLAKNPRFQHFLDSNHDDAQKLLYIIKVCNHGVEFDDTPFYKGWANLNLFH